MEKIEFTIISEQLKIWIETIYYRGKKEMPLPSRKKSLFLWRM